jgi:hypothetical protein
MCIAAMAIRAEAISFLHTRIFGVEGRPVSVRLDVRNASYVPEELAPLIVTCAATAGTEGKRAAVTVAFKSCEPHEWHLELSFPLSGMLLTRIEWHGDVIADGKEFVTVIDTGE